VVDDATDEAVAIVPERALKGKPTGANSGSADQHERPAQSGLDDNGKELCSLAMLAWAHARGVQLFLIKSPTSSHPAVNSGMNV